MSWGIYAITDATTLADTPYRWSLRFEGIPVKVYETFAEADAELLRRCAAPSVEGDPTP